MPTMWKYGTAKPRYKRGDMQTREAWRLITIMNTSGLLFERLFWLTVVEQVHAWLHPAQTGYRFACEDQMLVLHAIAEHRRAAGLPLIIILADLVKAFPRVWREYMVVLAAACLNEEQ